MALEKDVLVEKKPATKVKVLVVAEQIYHNDELYIKDAELEMEKEAADYHLAAGSVKIK